MSDQDTTNESIIIEDLSVQDADNIKGGPTPKSKRTIVLQSSVGEELDEEA